MPIPFAFHQTWTDDKCNLQYHFWQAAVENFDNMVKCADVYAEDDADFTVDAALVLVLLGTSLTQLLGQQWTDKMGNRHPTKPDWVDDPKKLFDNVLGSTNPLRFDFLLLNEMYENARHFGEPKHETVRAMKGEELANWFKLGVQIWKHTGCGSGCYFDRSFDWPK